MANSASKFKKNMLPILLTAIVIVGFLFSAVYLMNRVHPLFADANLKSPKEDSVDKQGRTQSSSFGQAGNFYQPANLSIWDRLRNWMAGNAAQQAAQHPYPGVDPRTGRWP